MRGSKLSLLAATLVAGLAGCSLPEVLPLAGGTHAGPSPYGPWYEQHWATNSVLLAAADQPAEDEDFTAEERAALDKALAEDAAAFEAEQPMLPVDEFTPKVESKVEVNGGPINHPPENVDFDNSSPYQFPASDFQPAPSKNAPPPAERLAPPPQASSRPAATDGPIRY